MIGTRQRIVLGVDPGLTGAIVALHPETCEIVYVYDIPTHKKSYGNKARAEIDIIQFEWDIRRWCLFHRIDHIYIEKTGAMPGQGVTSMFRFGETTGIIKCIMTLTQSPISYVAPARWKRKLGLSPDKNVTRARCVELWPTHRNEFVKVKHHNRADAALLARYGVTQELRAAA